MPHNNSGCQRILLLITDTAKMDFVRATLTQYGHDPMPCLSAEMVCDELKKGAGALILAKEDLSQSQISVLAGELCHQPTWSHLPLIVLLPDGEEVSAHALILAQLEKAANVTMVEAPVKAGFLVRTVRNALAYRERQFQMRELMSELEASRVEAIEASRAKSDFLANMSHEIRTPLGAILGFAELLMDPGISRAEKRDYMVAARRNGQMLSALIDDIRDLSRVEAGRLEISKIEFSLGELVSEVVTALEPLASKKGLPLTVYKPKEHDFIVSDPIRIKQILVNIVGNAIKFTSHGYVELKISIEPSPSGLQKLNIDVEDSGIGISPQAVTRLFSPFTQADTSSTRKFGGTGLGLVLSQRLARAMGGDLELKWSIPGGGSHFSIQLPVLAAKSSRGVPKLAAVPQPLEEAKLPLAGSSILLVDDSLDNQMLISRILELLGAKVDLANDGVEGVEKAMVGKFDVVLMDLQMPRMGGVEATRVLREKGYEAPIVALTAHSLQEDRQRCISVGCTDYLTKPIQRSLLVKVIERVSQGKSTLAGAGTTMN